MTGQPRPMWRCSMHQPAVVHSDAAPARHGETPMEEIRPCMPDDFPEVLLLLQQLWPGRFLNSEETRRVFERGLTCDRRAFLCATGGNKLIGFGALTVKDSFWQSGYLGYIDELVVDSACQGKGI